MATAHLASMLDELMGRNRNVAPNENVRELQWSDSEVCKYYVVEFCPHDLFTNTKADLGPCGKIHDDHLRTKFQSEKESYKKSQYMDEFLRFCQRMLTELQARIKKAKERLHLTQNDDALPPSASGQHKEAEEKISLLSQRINALVEEAEQAGIQGNVEQAQGLMKLSDQLRDEREQLRRAIMPFLNREEFSQQQQKAMEVCDICGAFLIVGDAQQRIDDHLMGKQHLGYARLRSAVEKINDERRKLREERDREQEERRKKRDDDDRSKPRRDRDRKRSRSRDRDRKRRSRDRSRERRRSPRRRSRSRDRKRRSRSRDSRRSRSRDRKRRSRSRERTSSRKGSRETSKD